jgi:glycosyltransferase involved in cell wall biosynthesis
MLEELLVPLQKRGHEVDVYLAKGRSGPGYDYRDLRVHRRGSDWTKAALDADVLITHLDQTSEVVGMAAVLDKPVVQILHNTHAPTKMWANCKADLLAYNSEWMAKDFGMPGLVVRPPVWASDYRLDETDERYDKASGYVTLINSSYRKGGLMLAMLAAQLPSIPFLLVKGAYGEQLDPNLPNVTVVEHGATPMSVIYHDTAILLMPSYYESWGRVGVEAMASGTPVIASNAPGLRESLDYAGTFCDWDDLDAWRHALMNLSYDPGAYAKASELAYNRSADLDPGEDIEAWIDAVERLSA